MYAVPPAMFTVTKLGLEPRLSGPAASGLALIWAHREAARPAWGLLQPLVWVLGLLPNKEGERRVIQKLEALWEQERL